MKFKIDMIRQIVEIERQLATMKFVKSGCIYFSGDIPQGIPGVNALVSSPTLPSSVLDRFKLGPLVSERLWRGKRATMDLDRGPCESLPRILHQA